jgi:sec-independent protein translocase protein TatA
MGLDNPLHIAVIVVLLLLVFGARRLPELGRSLGSGMREFKSSITGEAQAAQPTLSAGSEQPQPQAQPPQAMAPQPVAAAQPAQATTPEPVAAAQPAATAPPSDEHPAAG